MATNDPTPQLITMIQQTMQYLPTMTSNNKRTYFSIVQRLFSQQQSCDDMIKQLTAGMTFFRRIHNNALSSSSLVHAVFEPVFIVALSKLASNENQFDDLRVLLLTNLAEELEQTFLREQGLTA